MRRFGAGSISASVTVMILLASACSRAENATTPGEITTPYPTVTNLAAEWHIQGDDNLNGVVQVRFREAGAEKWRAAMPLRRVPAGASRGTSPIFRWKNKHSGSIFDLKPNTEYEIELKLKDPDGGEAEKTVKVRTRPVPRGSGGQITELPAGEHGVLETQDGQPGRPRIYRSADGKAVYKRVNMRNRKWVIVEGVTIRDTEGGRSAKAVVMNGASNCVVRRCNIRAVYGVTAYRPGCTNCYIADNVIEGTTPWTEPAMGASGKNIGEGIQVTGPGNVICYNKVTGFRDCISTMEDRGTVNQVCIDIYNNDVYTGSDDGIEADFCFNNCRVMRNRLTNCYVQLSSQPGLGGPTYFIRNSMYNGVHAAFKFKRNSRGDVALHNTIVKIGTGLGGNAPMDFAYFRNNLAIGGPDQGKRWGGYGAGRPAGARIGSPGSHSSFDYDAVGVWKVPYRATIGGKSFSEVEPHGVKIDMSVFDGVEFPERVVPGFEAQDLRPRPGTPVIDAALLIPNVNDDFEGGGPDIGAHEAGRPLPHYGPREPGVDEETEYLKRLAGGKDPGAAAAGAEKPEAGASGPAAADDEPKADPKAAKLFRAARAAERAGMKELAVMMYERLVKEFPDDPLAGRAKKKLE